MRFGELETLLLEHIRARVSDGELTERGLARRSGVSQPHIHLILRGLRTPSMRTCDELLECLRLSVLDLVPGHVLSEYCETAKGLVYLDLLKNPVGPGVPLETAVQGRMYYRMSAANFRDMGWPVAARLASDPAMADLFGAGAWVVLDQSLTARRELRKDACYLVHFGNEGRIRRIRRAGDGLYTVTEDALTNPDAWEFLGELGSPDLDAILARVWFVEPYGAAPGTAAPPVFPGIGE